MTTDTVLTDEQIDEIMCGPADVDYILGSPADRFRLFARAIEQAVLQSPEVQRLRQLKKALDEKIEAYERYGAICDFEGDPMIHASHLEELRDASMEIQP